jgi:hypothetical protein
MDRRKFVAASAGAIAVTATGAAAGVLGQTTARAAERVTLSGWVQRAIRGPGHYFVLGPDASVADPAVKHAADWPRELTLVLPSDAGAMRIGAVTLQGKLYRGKFVDTPTGHAAAAVLTEAVLV